MDKIIIKKLLSLYSEFSTIYGPYVDVNNDNREIIIFYNSKNKKRKTVSWPQAMMVSKLGRLLKSKELVDHIDNDPTNNTHENFQIIPPRENIIKGLKAKGWVRKVSLF